MLQDHLQPPFPWNYWIKRGKLIFLGWFGLFQMCRKDQGDRASLSLTVWRHVACLWCDIFNLGPVGYKCDSKHSEFGIALSGLIIFVFPGHLLIFNNSRNEFVFGSSRKHTGLWTLEPGSHRLNSCTDQLCGLESYLNLSGLEHPCL